MFKTSFHSINHYSSCTVIRFSREFKSLFLFLIRKKFFISLAEFQISSMVDQTITLPFYSHSRSSQLETRELGDEMGGRNENEYQQFEDTTVLDGPLVETQLEKLNFDTQVVDGFDCNADMRHHSISENEKEVVLDSEDEGDCASKTLRLSKGLSDGNSLNLQKIYGTCAHQRCSIGSKGFGVNVERSDEQKELPQLFNSGSGNIESEKSSQAIALKFVDQFLSSNNMEFEFSTGSDIKKTVKEKSPRLASRKGPQCLVQRMKFRAASTAKFETFQWADNDQQAEDDAFSKRRDTPIEFGRFRRRSVTSRHKPRHLNCEDGNYSDNKIEEKKKSLNLRKETAFSTYSDSRFAEHNPKETCRVEQVSKVDLESNCVKGTNEEVHGELSEQDLDAPDMFDVGFNTQIAAEAMEALSYGPSAGCIASDVYQHPPNITDDPLEGLITRKGRVEKTSLPETDCCYLIGSERKSTRRKRTSRKSGKKSNHLEPGPLLAVMTEMNGGKPLIEEQFKSRNCANSYENSSGIPTPMLLRQEDESVGRNNDGEIYKSSTISVERISLSKVQAKEERETSYVNQETRPYMAGETLKRTYHQSDNLGRKTDDGLLKYRRKRSRLVADPTRVEPISPSKEQVEEELKTSSCVDQETSPFLAGDILKRTYHQSEDPGQKKDAGILKYRRKRSRLAADPTKVVSGRERCPKLYADSSSAEARDSKLSKKEGSCKESSALTSCMKLDTWSHPKGKRALRKVRSHSKAYDIYISLGTVDRNVGKNYCTKSERITEDHHKSSTYHRESKEISGGEKAFTPFRGVSDMDFGLFSNGTEKNQEFGVSPNKNLELQSCGNTTTNRTYLMDVAASNHFSIKYHKRPFNKSLPKSFLLKELIKLGVPESIPGFTWKDLRRRKDLAHVRVLFSQHLDDNVIKQQKKISARLGISTATCPMDATHFIADRFVRTRNMLESIALGKPVVTHLWLESCGQARCLIDEKNYILRDAKKEKEIGFSMAVSVARASQHPLLEGKRIFITPNIKPPKEMISSLVQAVHGQVVEVELSQMSASASASNIQDNLFIVSCEEDRAICVPLLDKGVAAYAPELILNGIIIQKLEFERHLLFENHVNRKQTRTRLNKDVCLNGSL